nr:YheC/YheD family protein [Paenibacillus castaneae]
MVKTRNIRKRILKQYQRRHNLEMRVYAFTPSDINWKEKRIIGLRLRNGKWKESSFPFPHAVYNRCFNKKLTTITRLEQTIGKNKCFNTINFFNKWVLYNCLKKSDLKPYLPETFLYNEAVLSELVEKYKLIYIKPTYGAKGMSVHRVELKDNGDIHISLHSLAPTYICRKNESIQEQMAKLLGQKKYIIQQGIHMNQLDHHYFDIRALVQKNIVGEWTVTCFTCRVTHKHYFNTSICEAICDITKILTHLFSQEEMNDILQSLNELSIKAAQEAERQMGTLGELSVDFVLDDQNKLWIIELNGKPQKDIYNDLRDSKKKKRIYRRPLEYAYYLSHTDKSSEES